MILASSSVPGNETAVSRVINDPTRPLARGWCTRATRWCTCPGITLSGELLYVLNLVRPSNFIPVHGEWQTRIDPSGDGFLVHTRDTSTSFTSHR